ncbi:MAG TPA: hypothetical protein VMJ70_06615 [Candidatus Sulfotelmatobacter sp.]|nr:hypothetical protein [Candidatus Sulfotelmatobacter sp.]
MILLASWAVALALVHPATGSIPRRPPPPTTRVSIGEPGAFSFACGARNGGAAALLQQHWAQPDNAPLPTPNSTDVGNIAVLEDDGRFFFSDKNGNAIADQAAIAQAFYRTHGDDYDCLAVFLSTGLSTYLGSPTAIAAADVLRSRTSGLGLDLYDLGAGFGSPSRLEWMLAMNGLGKYPDDPDADISGDSFSTLDVISHEFGHRWLAYVRVDSAGTASTALLGRAYQHWSMFFDSDASFMEGCDWSSPAPDSFAIDDVSSRYGKLDLYLMGLRSAADTDSFFTLHDATNFDPPGTYVPYTWPPLGLTCHARQHWWHVSDVAAANGPRVPDASTAPHSFRIGFILVTARGNAATAADLAKLETLRSRFPSYFAAATQGLGSIDASITSRAGSVRIAHTPLHDRTDLASPIPVGAHITVDQAGIPLTLDAASPRLFWRAGTSGSFSSLPMAIVAPDSFAAQIPAPGAPGKFQYYLYASSDSSGLDAFDPPAGAAAPITFVAGSDTTLPVITHTSIPIQGEALMPVTLLARVTDNVGVDSVRVLWGVDGAITHISNASPVGRDSFSAAIGAGVAAGHVIDYYFWARDAAGCIADGFQGSLNQTPQVMHVGKDWVFDSDNGDGGLTHSPYWYSYRDAWHLTHEDSWPPGGTAWKCGDDAPLPYPPHLDSNLYLPVIGTLPAGTQLRFEHRYDLEEADPFHAYDGARVEIQVGSGPWTALATQAGYSHQFFLNSNPFQSGTPCWSGNSGGWRSEVADLTPYAPGPVRIRFRMLADDFIGYDGWIVDHVVVDFPDALAAVSSAATTTDRAPWPNPARDGIRISLANAGARDVEWALYDLQGRRLATLWSGHVPAGGAELSARLPQDLRAGLYFSRVTMGGRALESRRVAVIR